jgi:regulator of protease activity HflC (stomatin/prohibitin superfamily)
MNNKAQSVKSAAIFGVIVFVIIVGLGMILGSFYTVSPGERAILLTWGNPDTQAQTEGLHFKIPIAQSVVIMDIKTQKYDADASAASKDLQIVSTKIAVNYHLQGEGVVRLYTEIGTDYSNRVIQPAVQEVVKASTAKFTAEELITKRELVKQMIDAQLKERLVTWGIIMDTTSITNFDFSAEFNKAIEAKVTLEQQSLAEKNRLDMITFQAQQLVATAKGTADSVKLQKDAEAYGNKVVADSEAYKLAVTRQQLELSPTLIQYKYLERWDGKVAQYNFGSNGVTPVIAIDTGNIVPIK